MSTMHEKKEFNDLAAAPSITGETSYDVALAEDAVFGTITEDGPNYRNVRI